MSLISTPLTSFTTPYAAPTTPNHPATASSNMDPNERRMTPVSGPESAVEQSQSFSPSGSAGREQRNISPVASSNGSGSGSATINATGSGSTSSGPPDRITVPSACVACRSKHLKCDGLIPCTRCSSNDFECIYVRSRRGFKGPRRNGGGQNKASAGVTRPSSCPMVRPTGSNMPSPMINTPYIPTGLVTPPDNRLQVYPPTPPFDFNAHVLHPDIIPIASDIRGRCTEGFFYHFFPAHSFVLPQAHLLRLLKEKPLGHLEAAMRYVGSFYVESAPTAALGVEAEQMLYSLDCPKDAFRVQGLLILAIGLDGFTHQDKALQILNDAISLALELGMNKREFALMNGNEWSVMEESWRRTWWELFVIDGMIAGVHQKSSFPMKDIPNDVGLPCEEMEYISGQIPPCHSLEDFDDEGFDGRDFTYSSFAYRIAAIRNLGRLLKASQAMIPDDPIVDRIDAHLVNWRLHLPDSKKNLITADGTLDEMLFQANMITCATTIVLHRELSQLDSSVAKSVVSCAPHRSIIPGSSWNIHAAKTIQAAQDISKLVLVPIAPTKHTHFFTCVITLSSIVHLSVWSAMMSIMHDEDLKQQLRLNIGGLKSMASVWPSAGPAFGQVKGVAQEIFGAKKSAAEVGYWTNNFTQEEVMRHMIEDQNVMEELQLL